MESVDGLVRALMVGHGAAGRADPLPGIEDSDLAGVVEQARAQRVIGPTVWGLSDAGADLSDDAASLARDRFQGAMAWCLELELRLIEVSRWFDEIGGVDFLVLKGAAVAHLDEVDPSQRSFADLDLLIAATDMDRALRALQTHGAVRRIPEHHPGFDRRFVKGVGLTCPDGIEIDVHRALCVGALGFRIPLDELFANPEHFTVGGKRFAALRLEHRALHAAYHATVGSPHPALHTVRDLYRYLARPQLSPDVLSQEASRWRGETVLWAGVEAVSRSFGDLPGQWQQWFDEFEPSQRDLRLIEASCRPARWPIDPNIVRELGWRHGSRYTWGVLFPSPTVLAERAQTRRGRLRRGLGRMAGRQ